MSTFYIVEPPVASSPTPVYDYGSVYTTIANQLASIDTDTTGLAATLVLIAASLSTMAGNSTTIATNLTTLAEKLTAIETYQKKVKELAEGEGVHMISPLEYVGFITSYRRLIEEGKILSWRDEKTLDDKNISKSLNDLGKYLEKIQNNIPKAF